MASYQSPPYAPPPQQPPAIPRYYPSPQTQSTPMSPSQYEGAPAPKRQKLTPDPQSPYATSPQITNGSVPNRNFNVNTPSWLQTNTQYQQTPYAPPAQASSTNGISTPTQTQAQTPNVMGPPARPVAEQKPAAEQKVDINQIGDVVLASGLDLKAEEAALFQPRTTPVVSYVDPWSYNTQSPNAPGSRDTFYGSGTANQVPLSVQSSREYLAAQAQALETRARRRRAERQQYHMNDPFLTSGAVYEKLTKISKTLGPKGFTGVYSPLNQEKSKLLVLGPDYGPILTALSGQQLTSTDSPVNELISLLSLAARDRIRTLLEDATSLARGRRQNAHGIVPTDLQDLATGPGAKESANGTPLPLIGEERRKDELPDLLKNPADEIAEDKKDESTEKVDGETEKKEPEKEPVKKEPTISFANRLSKALEEQIKLAKEFEAKRLANRKKREAEQSKNPLSDPAASPAPPDPASLIAPDPKKTTKKEAKRQKEQADEARQVGVTNVAASMALGGSKLPAWMTKGKATAGGSGFGTPKLPNANISKVIKPGVTPGSVPAVGEAKIGDWREDKEDGKGIQIRDLLMAMETDPKEKKALARVYARLKSKEK